MIEGMDKIDLKRIADRKFDFIGVEKRVDTNRNKTKEEKALEIKRAILAARIKKTSIRRVSKKDRDEKIYRHKQFQREELHNSFNGNSQAEEGA